MTGARRSGFRPSLHGCSFGNSETVGLAIRWGRLPLGRVTGGLCGGMVLDSLRSWRLGRPPAGRTAADLTRVFAAQLRSFQVPSAPWRYLRLQQPGAGRARRHANAAATAALAARLEAGEPTPVALVCRLSRNPFALSAHHVVLAYDVLAAAPAALSVAIYDPNHPGDDRVSLRIGPDGVRHSHRSGVHAAFVLRAR